MQNSIVEFSGKLTVFTVTFLRALFLWKIRVREITLQLYYLITTTLPLISVISFFIGIIIGFQTAYQLKMFSSEVYIAPLVALSIVRELGPVLTAFVIAGRSGSSITAQIGSMKITQQLDALRVLAVDPLRYLGVPRFLALVIGVPILVMYADCLGVLGGALVGFFKLNVGLKLYFRMTFDSLGTKDIVISFLKALVFGSSIFIVSCFEGFAVHAGASGLARGVRDCVVKCFILIIIYDCILTGMFYFLR